MSLKAPSLAVLAGAIGLAMLGSGNAQAPASPPGMVPQTYRPGLGDLMTMTVQPRHTKLGLAGQGRTGFWRRTNFTNWKNLSKKQ